MESRVIAMYDYHKVDLSEFFIHFTIDEEKIADEMNRLVNREATWEDGTVVSAGDIAEVSLNSKVKRYNKPKLKIAVECNLFDPELEAALCGMHKGETKEITTAKGSVQVTVNRIMNKRVPQLTDEVIAKFGPEGISSQAQFREFLIEQQKSEAMKKVYYSAEQKILKEVHDNSDYLIKHEDWTHAVTIQMNRYAALAESEGMELRKMTAKEFEGRIPVASYDQLVSLAQESAWRYMEEYLAGSYYAREDGIDISDEAYETYVKEYAEFWKVDDATARKVNTYEEFVINRNKGCFYNRIRNYIANEIIKEN